MTVGRQPPPPTSTFDYESQLGKETIGNQTSDVLGEIETRPEDSRRLDIEEKHVVGVGGSEPFDSHVPESDPCGFPSSLLFAQFFEL